MLGEVRSFSALDLSGEALVKPAVNFSDLEFVFVIERDDSVAVEEPAETGGVEEGQ